jgi:hypothetical protein
MKIYNRHPKTREFLSATDALPSPLEKGVYLIPANASKNAPPPTGEHEIAVHDPETDTWPIHPDYRGTVFYSTADGHEVKVTEIGALADVQPPDTTPDPMPTAPPGQKTVWGGAGWMFEYLPPPSSVPARGARLALKKAGLYDQINEYIAAIPADEEGEEARIEWEFATEYQRDNPLIGKLAGVLKLSDAELDALFRQAATL